MKIKREYESPALQLILFDAYDVMTTSGFDWSIWDDDGDGWSDGWV
jgi:hypothetical protein